MSTVSMVQERALFSDVDDPIEDLYHLIREEVAGDSSLSPWMKMILPQQAHPRQSQVKSSHLYLYSAFNNTDCVNATSQYQNSKIVCQ